MKIVIFPGVGFQDATDTYEHFAGAVAKRVGGGCSAEVHYWHNGWTIPLEPELCLDSWRQWMSKVILDFQKVVKEVDSIPVPDADCYIGHSAGSIIAIAHDKPCITLASPAALVEPIVMDQLFFTRGIDPDKITGLNVVHRYDMIAHTLHLKGVENWLYNGSLWSRIPILAHVDYWKRDDVAEKIGSKIKEWQVSGVLPK